MKDLTVAPRIIMTPGPVEVDPRVLRAMSSPILGQFDPLFTEIMQETMNMLKLVFQTNNRWAYPVDGTSRAGLEAVLHALIEQGDVVLVPVFGRFGYLLVEIATRLGAEVKVIERPWGTVFEPDEVVQAIRKFRPKVVAVVHGETSTGRMQPLADIGRACREYGAYLVVDAVATVGGVEVRTDDWLLDAVVAGTQKCLSVPAGLAPLTYNERVERVLESRKRVERGLWNLEEGAVPDAPRGSPILSNYLDLAQIQDYWGPSRLNHHTEATSMLYALREGLRLVLEEGLEARFRRHRQCEFILTEGLRAMGLALFGDPGCKLPVVTCVEVPPGIDSQSVRHMLLHEFGIEIADSFGPLKGRIWRIGTMGYSCRKQNVFALLGALGATLRWHGFPADTASALAAALHAAKKTEAWEDAAQGAAFPSSQRIREHLAGV
ncbi:purine catabolism protein PucG [Alicyclobacillus cellulosilyticus]|uniref:Purine catabolism protein PucG n=1 Tax=Alicyclobacillus cellulosilyticus TaxID=1003997 RepID=A0A917KEU1_9BACL|nr:alanine--glyoxylate aminotransferase family protein [Alicyclobacillus cellulosilyticus]GGJ10663.1 purine catabolism protein PucG [Alicyclobacillus cellulosilyticus]